MTTKYIDLEATINWAQSAYGSLFEPDPKYGKYKANFYLTPESWAKYNKLGLGLKTYSDDDGDYVTFKRDHKKAISGKMETLGPPKVFFVEGIEPTKEIGNGSSCVVTVAVYGTPNGPAHRLQQVIITDLVAYTRGSKYDTSTMATLPDTVTEEVNEYSDDIPFGKDESIGPVKDTATLKKATPFRR